MTDPKAKLDVEGTTNISERLTVGGTTNLLSKLNVDGHANLRSGLRVEGNANITGKLQFYDGDSTDGNKLWSSAKPSGIYGHWNGAMSILANGVESMRIDRESNVGIGTSSPVCPLHIKQSGDDPDGGPNAVNEDVCLSLERNSDTSRWSLWVNGSKHLHFGLSNNSGSSDSKGYLLSTVASDAPGNELNFTGQHRSITNNNLTTSSVGLICYSNGNFINIDNSINPSISESLPIVEITNQDNDKRVFGVLCDKEDTNTTREYGPGNFVSVYKKTNTNEQRMFINSVGEGAIWVCNKGSDSIENGDYITSSTVAGYGVKQTTDEGTLKNFTVAKITCDCNFSLEKTTKKKLKVITTTTDGVTTTAIDYDSSGNVQYENDLDSEGNTQQVYDFETRFLDSSGNQLSGGESDYTTRKNNNENVYIACFVGCTYHCG
jgi:hypothetical protein